MRLVYRFTLEWFVEFDFKDFATGEERIYFNCYGRHIYCSTLPEALSKRDWHVADFERWLPKDAYRGDYPAYAPAVSELLTIEKP